MTLKDKLNLLLNEHTVEVLQGYKSEGNTAFYLEMAQVDLIEDVLHVITGQEEQQDLLHDMAWDIFNKIKKEA
jgi:hypothetical protein